MKAGDPILDIQGKPLLVHPVLEPDRTIDPVRTCFSEYDNVLRNLNTLKQNISNYNPSLNQNDQAVKFLLDFGTIQTINNIIDSLVTINMTTVKCMNGYSSNPVDLCAPLQNFNSNKPINENDLIYILDAYSTITQKITRWIVSMLEEYMKNCNNIEQYNKAKIIYHKTLKLFYPCTIDKCIDHNQWYVIGAGAIIVIMCIIIIILIVLYIIKK